MAASPQVGFHLNTKDFTLPLTVFLHCIYKNTLREEGKLLKNAPSSFLEFVFQIVNLTCLYLNFSEYTFNFFLFDRKTKKEIINTFGLNWSYLFASELRKKLPDIYSQIVLKLKGLPFKNMQQI